MRMRIFIERLHAFVGEKEYVQLVSKENLQKIIDKVEFPEEKHKIIEYLKLLIENCDDKGALFDSNHLFCVDNECLFKLIFNKRDEDAFMWGEYYLSDEK